MKFFFLLTFVVKFASSSKILTSNQEVEEISSRNISNYLCFGVNHLASSDFDTNRVAILTHKTNYTQGVLNDLVSNITSCLSANFSLFVADLRVQKVNLSMHKPNTIILITDNVVEVKN